MFVSKNDRITNGYNYPPPPPPRPRYEALKAVLIQEAPPRGLTP